MNATLTKLRIYPIKSLDPVELNSVKIGEHCLLGDRKYAILNKEGEFINGKRTGRVNQLETKFDLELNQVSFNTRGNNDKRSFDLSHETEKAEAFLTEFFNLKVFLVKNESGRLMDIPDESAVTVVAYETLKVLSDKLKDPLDTFRLRFRSNIEISNVPPYWEEQLVNYDNLDGIRFRIGEVEMRGMSLRARCNVPPRNPFTGETDKSFIKKMILSREDSIPPWSQLKRLNNLYHLTVNTFIPDSEFGKQLNLGDTVELI